MIYKQRWISGNGGGGIGGIVRTKGKRNCMGKGLSKSKKNDQKG